MILREETIQKYNFDPDIYKKNSNKFCVVRCDFCNTLFERIYNKILNGRKNCQLDACEKIDCQTQKRKKVFLSKYGTEHVLQSEYGKNKFKNTCLERYGVENPFQSEEKKEKIKNTTIKKYGVEHIAYSEEVSKKKKETNIQRYGVEYPYQNETILNKVTETLKKNYGVSSYAKTDLFISRFEKEKLLTEQEIIDFCNRKQYKPLFKYEEYKGCREKQEYYCNIHQLRFVSEIFLISHPEKNQCPSCKLNGTSKPEREIIQYIKEIYEGEIKENIRSVIPPNELDVFLPEKNIAIEFNGLYWHSSLYKDKFYHKNKFIECQKKNIKLLQFYEDEWRDKRDICKSIIKNKLNLNHFKLNARDLNFKMYNIKTSTKTDIEKINKFVDENHLQGRTIFNTAFCLEDKNNDIVCCITMRLPFTKNEKSTIEIARFCSKKCTNIRGSFSKLLKYIKQWAKEKEYKTILTYSDCRHSLGETYQKYGFSFIHHTPANYFYFNIKDLSRQGRYKWRARHDLGLTEKALIEKNEMLSIYDAGNFRWELNL